MDFNMSLSASAGFIVLVLTVLSYTVLGWVRNKSGRFALPGPFPLPIIGNLHQLGALPHSSMQRLAEKYGPIMSLRLGSVPVVVVSSSEAAKQFLKTHDSIFASRPPSAAAKYLFYDHRDIAFSPYGAYWRNMRKICVLHLLSANRIKSFKCLAEEEAWAMVRFIWEKSEEGRVGVNVRDAISSYSTRLTWRVLMGKTTSHHFSDGSAIQKLAAEAAALGRVVTIGDLIPCLDWLDLQGLRRRMKNTHKQLDALFGRIIEEHVECKLRRSTLEEHEHEHLVDVLVDLGGEITLEDKKAILMDMFVAGIEPSTFTLEWAVVEIFRNSHVRKKLQEEIDFVVQEGERITDSHIKRMEYLHCVIKETLRLHPILPLLIPHESTQTCIVEGAHGNYLIPTKSRVIVNAWAIGRDPRIWEDPLEFNPERFVGKDFDMVRDSQLRMIPFGAGRRSCPGFSMAITTIEIALAHIFHYFNWRNEEEKYMNKFVGDTIPKRENLIFIPTWRLRGFKMCCDKMECL